ncbi:MAG: hypothetical protein GXO34_06600 [Deltaproteobacteria bacterium]|nr:hypothetical protein [Deltaproteobacteria bacterium]
MFRKSYCCRILFLLPLLAGLLLFFRPPVLFAASADPVSAPRFSLTLRPGFSPFLAGDAGRGAGAPDYDDIFHVGRGIALEAGWRLNRTVELVAGAGYERFGGGEYQGLDFDNLEVVPLYCGSKFFFPVKSPVRPYAEFHVGAAHLSKVEVSWYSLSTTYWDSAWVPLADLGLGLECELGGWRLSGSVRARYLGAPDDRLEAADADASWTFPVYLGIGRSF